MAFPTEGFGGVMRPAAGTGKTALNKTLFQKKFLEVGNHVRKFGALAQKQKYDHPKHRGDTQEFTQYLRMAPLTSALTEGTTPSGQNFVVQKKSFTLEEWGDYFETSSFFNFTTWDANNEGLAEVVANWMNDTLELKQIKCYATKGSFALRADMNPSYQMFKVAVTTGTSTTSIAATSLVQGHGDGYWIGAKLTFTSGPATGQTTWVTAFTEATGTLTLSPAVDTTPTTDSEFTLASPAGLTSSNIITADGCQAALMYLAEHFYMPFTGGWAAGLLSPRTKRDAIKDSLFRDLLIHHSSGQTGLFKNSISQVWGIDWQEFTLPYRADVTTPSTYGANEEIEFVPIMGRNCIGMIEPTGSVGSGEIIFGDPKIVDPKMHMKGSLGFKYMGADATLNTTWGATLMCGYTP